jgi:hypothetical protein
VAGAERKERGKEKITYLIVEQLSGWSCAAAVHEAGQRVGLKGGCSCRTGERREGRLGGSPSDEMEG